MNGPEPVLHVLIVGELHADGGQTSRTWALDPDTLARVQAITAALGAPAVEVLMTKEQLAEAHENTKATLLTGSGEPI